MQRTWVVLRRAVTAVVPGDRMWAFIVHSSSAGPRASALGCHTECRGSNTSAPKAAKGVLIP